MLGESSNEEKLSSAEFFIRILLGLEPKSRVDMHKKREVALLLIWAYFSEIKKDKELPPLSVVSSGKIALNEAFKHIAEVLSRRDQFKILRQYFLDSNLPDSLALTKAKKIIKLLEQQSTPDKLEYLAEVFYKDREESWQHPLVIPTSLAELMFRLGDPSADEMYCFHSASRPLAKIHAEHGKTAILESDSNPPLMWLTSLPYDINLISHNAISAPSLINKDGSLKQYPIVQIAQHNSVQIDIPEVDPHGRFPSNLSDGVLASLYHGLAQCSGKLVALIPQGYLFRGGDSYDFRRKVVDTGILDVVIQLPGKALENGRDTSIALLIINKQRDPNLPVLFYDSMQDTLLEKDIFGREKESMCWDIVVKDILNRTDNDFSRLVTLSEIADIHNRYDLSVRRYVVNSESGEIKNLPNTRQLVQISDLMRAQSLKEDKLLTGNIFHVVTGKDILASGEINEPEHTLVLNGKDQDKAIKHALQPNDILISIKGNIGLVGFIGDNCGNNWVASQLFQVIRLKEHSEIDSSPYLFTYLRSPLVQAYLNRNMAGAGRSLKSADLRELLVPVPTTEQLEETLDTYNEILGHYYSIEAEQSEIDELMQIHWGKH